MESTTIQHFHSLVLLIEQMLLLKKTGSLASMYLWLNINFGNLQEFPSSSFESSGYFCNGEIAADSKS